MPYGTGSYESPLMVMKEAPYGITEKAIEAVKNECCNVAAEAATYEPAVRERAVRWRALRVSFLVPLGLFCQLFGDALSQ